MFYFSYRVGHIVRVAFNQGSSISKYNGCNAARIARSLLTLSKQVRALHLTSIALDVESPFSYLPIATKVTVQELPGGNGAAVLSLPEGINWPSLQSNRLFKRDFYDRFIDIKMRGFYSDGFGRCLLTGTPGIGKSSFILYVVWKALQMGKTVVYQHYRTPSTYTVFKPGSSLITTVIGHSPRALDDCNAVFVADDIVPQGAEAFTLFVSTAEHNRMHQYTKDCPPVVYFPTWTFEEVKLMRTYCFDRRSYANRAEDRVELTDEELWTRYNTAGGVLRSIFLEKHWSNIATNLTYDAVRAVELIRLHNVNIYRYHGSTHCFHMRVNRSTFKCDELMFASNHVERMICQRVFNDNRDFVARFMVAIKQKRGAEMFRCAFHKEIVCHRLTVSTGAWKARSLDSTPPCAGDTGSALPTNTLVVPLPCKHATAFDHIDEIVPGEPNVPILWRPSSNSFVTTDMLITVGGDVYFMQCTVSSTHAIILRANAPNLGLMQQAEALAERGFNTTEKLNVVHVTEPVTEPGYRIGDLRNAEEQQAVNCPPTAQSESKQYDSDADRARVAQWVVGVDLTFAPGGPMGPPSLLSYMY